MEIKEYDLKMKQIVAKFEEEKKQLYLDFAMSKVIYKIGDIIKHHDIIIKIDKISTYKSFSYPCPVYSGFELKKDLTIKKNKNRLSVYDNTNTLLIKSNI